MIGVYDGNLLAPLDQEPVGQHVGVSLNRWVIPHRASSLCESGRRRAAARLRVRASWYGLASSPSADVEHDPHVGSHGRVQTE
jgi:hypothetical protein